MAQCLFNQMQREWSRLELNAANVGIVYFIMKNREPHKSANREPRKRRRYTDEEKAAALTRLVENSNLNAPLVVTARELQVNDKTLFAWSTGRGVARHILNLVEQKKQTAADLYDEISVLANVRLIERLSDEAMSISIPARDLMNISAVSTDKSRLVREKPTSITENRNDAALREKAEAILATLLPEYNFDRELALAAMRENAPTLSSYVN